MDEHDRKDIEAARDEELGALLTEAAEKHLTFGSSPIPGFASVSLDADVEIGRIGRVVRAGTYYLRIPESQDDIDSIDYLWRAIADPDEIETAHNEAAEAGILPQIFRDGRVAYSFAVETVPAAETNTVNVSLAMETIHIKMEAGGYELLSLTEVTTWLAIQDAQAEGNEDKALRIVLLAYPKQDEPQVNITTTIADTVDFPTDKLNRRAWRMWSGLKPGQLAMGFSTEYGRGEIGVNLASETDKKSGIELLMTYGIDFAGLEGMGIIPKLDPFDKRIYDACASLWSRLDRDVFTLREILEEACFTNNGTNRKRGNDSLTKMSIAHIWYDNLAESKAYKYDHYQYDGSLLPMERVTGYVDGIPSDALVHLFREPPLFTFARKRKQFTTHKRAVLQTPISKTNTNLQIEDYLREQIAFMKGGKRYSNKVTFDAIFEAANVTTRKAKDRKKRDVIKVLDHYVSCGWINGYREVSNGFEIFCGRFELPE